MTLPSVDVVRRLVRDPAIRVQLGPSWKNLQVVMNTRKPPTDNLQFRRALAIDEKALGPNHPDVATDLNNLKLFQMALTKMDWASARQKVLAQNVANADTPDYKEKDLKALNFKSVLRETAPVHVTRHQRYGLLHGKKRSCRRIARKGQDHSRLPWPRVRG